jgi:hypothetical protein
MVAGSGATTLDSAAMRGGGLAGHGDGIQRDTAAADGLGGLFLSFFFSYD